MTKEIFVSRRKPRPVDFDVRCGDALAVLSSSPEKSAQMCVTSPPYWGLRDYGVEGQLGLEKTPEEYVAKIVAIFAQVKRVLKDDGTLWLNLGDSYCSSGTGSAGTHSTLQGGQATQSAAQARISKPAMGGIKAKDLIGIPWMVAFALRADGWYLRSDIIWAKPNPMPESVKDRPTRSHEYMFLLSKSAKYYYDHEAIKEPCVQNEDANGFRGGAYTGGNINNGTTGVRTAVGNIIKDKQRGHSRRHDGFNDRWDSMTKEEQCANGKNKRDVWNFAPYPFAEAHFATFPPKLILPCILAGSRPGDVVLDPFFGAGTTGLVALQESRRVLGIELNPDYITMAKRRCGRD